MARARLLVVEDEPNLLMGIRDILKLDDYEVITAQNGQEALEVLEGLEDDLPDLIISDIMMPVMDGIALLESVRKRSKWVTLPFIFLTAKGEKTDIQRGKMMGVDDYVIKPFEADDLLVAVDARLRRHDAISQAQVGEISNMKRSILTILNHEFRTPLTLVVAYAEMLKDSRIDEMNEEELLLFLREINSGADRLRHLIENFIMLVELETGDAQKTFEWRKRKLENLRDLITESCQHSFDGQTIEHRYEIRLPDTLPVIIGDDAYLKMVLRELLDNAKKFSEPVHPVRVLAEATPTELHIQVIDYGRGIPASEFENIWKSFYQIRRDHYEDQGAGSGLTLVKGLTEIHGGRVEVTSSPGEGSCFTVVLPVAPI